jgi:hypothetical protein
MYEDLDAVGLLSAMQDDQRAERSATTRRLIAAGRLCRQRIAEMGDDRDQWCIDGWEAVAAEVGAELRISRGRASSLMNYGLTLLERLPRLAAVCLAGDVDFRVIALIEYRTGLITDADVLARIDVALARQVPHWSSLSRDKVAELIDWLVVELDPEAVRMARQADVDRHIEVGPSANGMAEVWGRLRATDGAAFDKTLDELAASVCPDDPRTKVQRRADAVIALTNRAMTMACTCGSANCSAAGGTDADCREGHRGGRRCEARVPVRLRRHPRRRRAGTGQAGQDSTADPAEGLPIGAAIPAVRSSGGLHPVP